VDAPQVQYAKSGDVHIAYQVLGSGPVDLVFIPGLFSNLDHNWAEPGYASFLHRLAAFSRLIVVDPRGTGLSDRAQRHPPMEEQVDDMLSVLDAVGSRSAAFFGFSQAGPIALLFAATHPERTRALVLYATYATPARHEDYPWGRSEEWIEEFDRRIEREWGTGFFLPQIAPSRVNDPALRTWWARMERLSCGPGNAQAYYRVYSRIDLRSILPSIRVPTLVLQRREDVFRDPGHSQYLAHHIPRARLIELSGVDHLPYVGDVDVILEEVQEFLTGVRPLPHLDRVLATVLFTDIVGSTDKASVLGDREWKELLERHNGATRQALVAFRGVEIGTRGDATHLRQARLEPVHQRERGARTGPAARCTAPGQRLNIQACLHAQWNIVQDHGRGCMGSTPVGSNQWMASKEHHHGPLSAISVDFDGS
jgi:pimeloyl-ACP methyl ester carboxylesterase